MGLAGSPGPRPSNPLPVGRTPASDRGRARARRRGIGGVTGTKGGYHADGRLEATLDEISMEALAAAASPSIEVWRLAFLEIARLARAAKTLLSYINGGQPPMGLCPA